MPFSEALFVALDTMIMKVRRRPVKVYSGTRPDVIQLFMPRVFFRLPIKTLRHSDAAYTELRQHIQELIQDARSGKSRA